MLTCNINCDVSCSCVEAIVCNAGVSSYCHWGDSKTTHCSQYWHITWLSAGKKPSICFHSNLTPSQHCPCNSKSQEEWQMTKAHSYFVAIPMTGTGLPLACSHCTSLLKLPVDWQVTLNSRPGFTVYISFSSSWLAENSSTTGRIPGGYNHNNVCTIYSHALY